jgi:hypothetical protein
VLGQPVGIFRRIIVESGLGPKLGDHHRLVVENGDGQLPSLDERLREQPIEIVPRPGNVAADRRTVIALLSDDRDADRRALVDRLEHIGPRDRVALEQALAPYDPTLRHADAVRHQHQFRQLLVDCDNRRCDPAMGIFEPHQVEHSLDGTVLARSSVKRVEHDVRLQLVQPPGDFAVHVELGDPAPAVASKRLGDAAAAGQRHLAFGRPPAHQHHDVKVPVQEYVPIRWISHSS